MNKAIKDILISMDFCGNRGGSHYHFTGLELEDFYGRVVVECTKVIDKYSRANEENDSWVHCMQSMKEEVQKHFGLLVVLKPCPFCGNPVDAEDGDVLHTTPSFIDPNERIWVLNCPVSADGCGVQVYGDTKQEVIARWNSRYE